MKILFPLEYYYPSDIGGPANALYWHTKMLKKHGVDSVVVTSDVGTKGIVSDEWIVDGNSKLIYCSGGRLSSKIFRNALKEVAACDVLHLSSVCYPYNIFFTVYARLKGKKVVISPRGELFPQAYMSKKAFAKKILFGVYRLFQKKITFHATSTEEENCIRAVFPKAEIVIQPNLIEAKYSDVPATRGNNLVFLGRINPIKSIDKLLKALSLSKAFMDSDAKLVIVGSARLAEEIAYKEKLEQIIEELKLNNRVVFAGTKFGEEKFDIINNSKALVLPSESENFGNVVTEALSQSVPVIASTGTPWQVLNESQIGWWTENSPEKLAAAIDELYSLDNIKYEAYCLGAKKYVEDNLDIEKAKNNNWVEIYNK